MANEKWMFHSPEQRNMAIRDKIEMDGYGYQSRVPGGVSMSRESGSPTIAGAVFAVAMGLIALITWLVFV